MLVTIRQLDHTLIVLGTEATINTRVALRHSALLERHFPMFFDVAGRECVDPYAALAFVAAVEEASVRFYLEMARQAPDAASKAFFETIARQEAGPLHFAYRGTKGTTICR